MTSALQGKRVGYVPYAPSLEPPGDRRRFVHYARRRGIEFELADPTRTYDVVVLSERADVSVWHDYAKGKLVYDLIDSYLAIPRRNWKGRLRGLAKFVTRQSHRLQLDYWAAIERMCQRADAVVCTTEEQQADITPHCRNVHRILDVHSMVLAESKSDYRASEPFRLCWEGLPHTLSCLQSIAPVLQRIHAKRPLELHLVTDLEYFRYLGGLGRARTEDLAKRIFPGAKLHAWREETVAQEICRCDLAVIPLDLNDPFIAGKPENKLLLLWRMGMPVVTSATPAYRRAMSAAEQDWGCVDAQDWETKLLRAMDSESLRREAGEKGRLYAQTQFSEERILSSWDALFDSVLS